MRKIYLLLLLPLLSLLFINSDCHDNGISPPPIQGVQMTFVSSYTPQGNCSDSYLKNISGTDFAFLSTGNTGLEIVNVSNPASPQFVSNFAVTGFTEEAYVSIINDVPYVFVAGGSGGLTILNISNINAPVQDTILKFSGDYLNTVFVDEFNKILYTGGNNDNVHIVNLANLPLVSNITTYQPYLNSFINEIQVRDNIAFIAQDGGLDIVNVSNPSTPVRLSHGISDDTAYDVKLSGNYALVANNGNGVLVSNISNPSSPTELSYLNTTGIGLACAVYGSLVYVAEDASGVEVFDISNPAYPNYIAYYSTLSYSENVNYYNGYLFVSDYNNFTVLRYP